MHRLQRHAGSLGLLGLLGLLVGSGLAAGACDDDTSLVPPAPTGGRCVPPPRSTDTTLGLAPAFGNQAFEQPVEMVLGPEKRFYVLEQKGVIRVLDPGGAPATTALDIVSRVTSGGEAGLLGLAFDPGFAQNGFVYLDYTSPLAMPVTGVVFQSVIARFHSNDGGKTIDPASEKRLLVVDQPFANHNGGHIAFGPDGLLYIALGDGGSGGDPMGNGQNKNVLLGKILRIDPRSGDPYAIPAANPFARGGGRPEIFTLGMRNPWKFSFDTMTGDLWAGDVGQNKFEEVDRLVVGGNYGWNTREGKHCYGTSTTCATEGFIDPVVEYDHSDGSSITGGFVYRGKKIPSIGGKYVYGDFGSGRVWVADKTGDNAYVPLLLAETHLNISTFGQDADGELYVADYGTGTLKQLVDAPPTVAPSGPGVNLSETGCVNVTDVTQPAPGLLKYTVNSPLWSDGATKERSLFVPEGAKIGVLPDGDLEVPPGSVAVKTFSRGGRKIETRLFVRYPDATWAGYSYEWNDAQTDAVLLAIGKTKTLADGSSWAFPSRAQCFACHTQIAGFTLGLEARQLDHDEGGVNQLARFMALLDRPIMPGELPPLPAADSAGFSDEARARGYLHANCAMCHRPGSGSGAATIDLRVTTPFVATKTCNAPPQAGDLGVVGAKIIAPGDPAKSTLALRVKALDPSRMPPLATHVVDQAGVDAIEGWIRALPAACP